MHAALFSVSLRGGGKGESCCLTSFPRNKILNVDLKHMAVLWEKSLSLVSRGCPKIAKEFLGCILFLQRLGLPLTPRPSFQQEG